MNSPAAFLTCAKRRRSQVDPDAQKHPRHMGNLAEGVYHTPINFQTQCTLATSPDTGIYHDDDVVALTSPDGTGCSLVHQAISAAGVSAAHHADLVPSIKGVAGS